MEIKRVWLGGTPCATHPITSRNITWGYDKNGIGAATYQKYLMNWETHTNHWIVLRRRKKKNAYTLVGYAINGLIMLALINDDLERRTKKKEKK